MDNKEIIKRVIARIEKPEHWCQRAYARDKYGTAVDAVDPSAVQWCASVLRFVTDAHPDKPDSISGYNDTYIHEKVLDYLRAAL